MTTTTVRYLGLELTSPVILASSGLSASVDGVRRAEEAGAGAVVLKSLFEEQITADASPDEEEVDYSIHPEAEQYIREMGMHLGPNEHLRLIAVAKENVSIPVIASVNCITPRWWGDYGKQIATTGADALELNIALMPRERSDPRHVESAYCRIIEQVRAHVDLPLAVKIGPYFTNLPSFASRLRDAGADALVLFNRFYQLDINTDAMELAPGYRFSTPAELHTPLRWTSILSGELGCDLAASTGIHTGTDVVKMLLAGATAVQVCSAVYQHGYERISEMNTDLIGWMKAHGFARIADFRGRLNQASSDAPEAHERLQYIKALTGVS